MEKKTGTKKTTSKRASARRPTKAKRRAPAKR
jgi:hypothetical protein